MLKKEFIKKYVLGEFSYKRILLSCVFFYLSFCLFGCFFANNMIFQPPQAGYTDSKETIKIKCDDNVKISVVYLNNNNAEYTLLYCHGNATDMGYNMPLFEMLYNANFSVFAFDYHGYGTSEGKPNEENCYLDVEASYKYLIGTLKIPPNKIIVLGRSVGGGPATYIAEKKSVSGLILISPFLSAFRVVTVYPILPFDKFPNISRIANINCPLLIIHGENDNVIPFNHGVKLFQAAKEPKRKYWIKNAGHNNLFDYDEQNILLEIKKFATSINRKK